MPAFETKILSSSKLIYFTLLFGETYRHGKLNVVKVCCAFLLLLCPISIAYEYANNVLDDYSLFTTTAKISNSNVSVTTAPEVEPLNHEHLNDADKLLLSEGIRVVCLVMVQPPYDANKTASIEDTWGKRCNKLLFMSPGKDSSFPGEKLTTTLAFEYAYETHRNNADWFIMTDDNTYVIVENLRLMVSEYESNNAMYFSFGHKTINEGYRENSTGFVLSLRALRRFKKFNAVFCYKILSIDACLKILKVKKQESYDSLHRERFLAAMPEDTLFPNISVLSTKEALNISDKIFDCCSNTAVSFHQVKPTDMHMLDYLLYTLRPYNETDSFINKLSKDPVEKVRVLCIILTYPLGHIKAIHLKNTWGKRCNKLLFMSTANNDSSLSAIKLPVNEGPFFLWSKTKAAFQYVYKHHRNEADWFMKADDDTYVIVENLRYMLSNYNSSNASYFGFRFHDGRLNYMSGGAGYVISKAALDRFVNVGLHDARCNKTLNTWSEDREMGRCLKRLGVQFMDTRDSLGRGRFFHFTPDAHLFPDKVRDSWYWNISYYPLLDGPNCCSDRAISFHNVVPQNMYAFDYLLYNLRSHR